VLALIIAFVIPPKYEAVARLLPPTQSQNGATALLSQLAGVSGAASLMTGALNLKNPSDVYVAMLKSRTIQDRLINTFDLRKLYGKRTYIDARKKLEDNTDINSGKEGVITLKVEDKDPKRAKALADAYVTELLSLSENLAVSEASQRRKYFERQLEQEKVRLADAEVELKKTQQSTGMVLPTEQARAVVSGFAQLRGMVAAKEVQIAAMRGYATDQNPQLVQAQRELQGLREQLRQLEKDQPGETGPLLPVGRMPEAALEFLRKYRDFKYHETLYELIAKQYEVARLDEARDVALIQVLDVPVEPDKKAKPPRMVIIALSAITSFLIAWFAACVVELWKMRTFSMRDSEKLAFIRTAFRRR
jgi:capsule polysaccharide export protein KpsE/RkpR